MSEALFAFTVVLGVFFGFPAFIFLCFLISDAKSQRRLAQATDLTGKEYEQHVNARAQGGRRE